MELFVIYNFQVGLSSCSNRSTEQKASFKVLQFNVWQEGTMVTDGLDRIANVISESGADIVTFSEVRNYNNEDWLSKVKDALAEKGLTYHGDFVAGDVGLISKYPVVETRVVFDEAHTSDSGSLVACKLNVNSREVWVCAGHLDYKFYAVYLPRGYNGGYPDWKIRADEVGEPVPVTNVDTVLNYNKRSLKDEAIQKFIDFEKQVAPVPVILGMDLNGASHLDWTDRAKQMYGHNGAVIPWNNTRSLEEAGFTDAYRFIYPDEVTHSGITWPAYPHGYQKNVSWTPKADERDRIDYVFYKGEGIKASTACLVGPSISFSYGKVTGSECKDTHIYDNQPWPSDHNGVMVAFELD
ncbi:endonuclease/exonuclease/phosphatase family protein [Marinilabiliaceae bacterium JC017]|nr:endonuclease/exonuclease/phosphatase family protein [Marinilabiliaceae bacterium JC017]